MKTLRNRVTDAIGQPCAFSPTCGGTLVDSPLTSIVDDGWLACQRCGDLVHVDSVEGPEDQGPMHPSYREPGDEGE